MATICRLRDARRGPAWLLSAAWVLFTMAGCGQAGSSHESSAAVGDAVPGLAQDWPLPNTPLVDVATGRTVRLDRLQAPMLINFWASWCRPCLQEIPDLEALANDASLKTQVIGVAMDSGNRRAVQGFASQHGMHYRLLDGGNAALDARYGLVGFPMTYLEDAQGVVRRRLVGPQSETEFRQAIRAAIEPPG